jgi:carboxylesterase type B
VLAGKILKNNFFKFFIISDEAGAPIEKPMATLVYIHGESYEWNSGNLYDGTVVAAHSNIIVVTINFRLGIFGT